MEHNKKTQIDIESYMQLDKKPLTTIDIGDIHFCLEHRSVKVCGNSLKLTAKEFDIFALLIMNVKRVFTYEMIVDLVWRENYTFYSRKAISNHISNIKKKIRAISDVHEYIVSVHGVGYKFDLE